MGYNVTMDLAGVVIPGDKVQAAMYALKRLCEGYDDPHISEEESAAINADSDPNVERDVPGKAPSFAWVDTIHCVHCLDKGEIEWAMSDWRYEVTIESISDIEKLAQPDRPLPALTIHFFQGSKWGDDEVFWECLAPFLSLGAVITCHGEDDAYWRYRKGAEGGTGLIEEHGRIVWE